jgi:DNA-binding GntR family transcriptional regulator
MRKQLAKFIAALEAGDPADFVQAVEDHVRLLQDILGNPEQRRAPLRAP